MTSPEWKNPKQQEWYYTNRERQLEKSKQAGKKLREEKPLTRLIYTVRHRAKLKGLDFNIDETDLVLPVYCPILGRKLVRGTKYAPSLDRINSSLGYVKGNVWIISHKANVMKNDADETDLKRFADWVKTFQH